MIKVGDRVKFLNDVGGGVVTGFISKSMVNVEGDDGFEVPYPISQLVNVNAPELNAKGTVSQAAPVVETKVVEPEYIEPEGEVINGKDAPDFYFCFVPKDAKNPLSGEIEVFLINDSNFKILFTYSYLTESDVKTVETGNLKSNSRLKIDSLTQEDLSSLPDFGFQILRFKDTGNEWFQPVIKRFKVNPVRFYKASTFQQSSYFKRPAMVLKITANPLTDNLDAITEAEFKQLVKEKSEVETPVKIQKKKPSDEVVFDLHINELLDQPEGLSNREILEIQLEKVESEMNNAIRDHVKRIVFIHGVGQGVLKQEVANVLNRKFKKYYFQDASFKEYGYGATMVILRR
ncbi:DUF2027 domain-containing protein [Maribellus sp. YY47]|uniref:Smr/MutS family protein n=1 Tax=Maribellus sp. YY47 TaxID=2929486 RepID=UPI0020015AC4|nr:DUF2027 domain-containing protein [Maribellus sp. YY47]MCK3683146.1 DUF2027 domain-containing protein [Maribellus sp. YY47]